MLGSSKRGRQEGRDLSGFSIFGYQSSFFIKILLIINFFFQVLILSGLKGLCFLMLLMKGL